MLTKYDTIGIGYNKTRKADPVLAHNLFDLLQPKSDGIYIDVGCGTGNYTNALFNKGLKMTGVEPSDQMIEKARALNPEIEWIKGSAENTGLEDSIFDGAVCTLTIHHWTDLKKGFAEIARVVKPGGRLVVFTSLPEQTLAYWITEYFPQMMEDSAGKLPALDRIIDAFGNNWQLEHTKTYDIHPEIKDKFLYSGKYDPEVYFDEDIRQGISSFSDLAYEDEVISGLSRLREDINSGRISSVQQKYRHDQGDYLYIVATKNS